MLPDYRGVKKDLSAALDEFIRGRVGAHLGVLNEIKQVTLREGKDRTRIVRESGEIEDNPLQLRSVDLELKKEEIGKIPLPSLLRKLDEAAEKMAGQIARDLYTSVSAAVEKVGNAVDAKGKKLTAELILQGFAQVQIDFDANGQPILPDIHLHPALKDAAELATRTLEQDPELRRQFRTIIATKREEWREREASRKLVE